MCYRIELSYNLRETSNLSEKKRDLIAKAEKNKCEMHYADYEIWGFSRTATRNHMVMTFVFPEEQKHIIKFIRFLKEDKQVHIESVGYDNCIFVLLHASNSYLNMMDRAKALEFREKKKQLSKGQYRPILNAISARG